MKRHLILLAFLLSSYTSTWAAENSTPLGDFLISNLQNDQTLKVRYSYQGCFSGGTGILEINQRAAKYSAAGDKTTFAVYDLSNAEITALDKHLVWLDKKGAEGGCTTSTSYNLQIFENGTLINSQEISHNWCSFGLDFESEEKMDFSDLIWKIEQLSKTGLRE